MQVCVLGEIAAGPTGRVRPIAGPAQRRLFAALVARRNETISLSTLVETCWPDGPSTARSERNMRSYVHRVRRAIGDDGELIATVASGYQMTTTDGQVDADEFARLARRASQALAVGDAVATIDAAERALAVWRGPPYAEFGHQPWAVPEAAHLDELHVGVRTDRCEALIDLGRPGSAITDLEQLTHEDPFRERPRALLMRALYDSGRQVEALREFQQYRRLLVEEAGVEPSPELVALDRRLATGGSAATPRTVGSYELHERIGAGAFAVVHRATQRTLGRDVAVKIVRAELADDPAFIRRFEAEAQMVASIEHPNVVPLYDYWREPGQAFLVMRWMTGGSLETRLDDGPWSLEATADLVDQIAAALDAAHAREVVHRDVKPANILFDDAGRAFLGDFGIALMSEERSTPAAALSEGSPIFASPEQLRREPAGPEADVHALAIVAFALVAGRTPFADAPDEASVLQHQLHDPVPPVSRFRPGVPSALDNVLAIATAKAPADRYQSAGTFARAFRAAALGDVRTVRTSSLLRANPYVGLQAFGETDAAVFHGRSRLVRELLDHLRRPDQRLLVLVGPSGAGKSSVVRAGLLPAIRSGVLPGSDRWFTTSMVPGHRPYDALEIALLRVAVDPPSTLRELLRDGDRGIVRAGKRILPPSGGEVVLVIDQFEELFTSVTRVERDRFLRALTVTVEDPGSPIRVIATLRADFFDAPLRHPGFAPLAKASSVAVTPLAADELEEAITRPAGDVGVQFEPGLVAEIVADVNSQPGALPLLQYALMRLFEAVERSTISIADYRRMGGMAGALADRAEALYDDADDVEREALRHLFERLVHVGDGPDDTRRRIGRAELPPDPATDRMIERFGTARLLTFDRDPFTREPTIEIAHEALIRAWPRLREWLEDDRDLLRAHRHLTLAATGWADRGHDPGELYRGVRLEQAEHLEADGRLALNACEISFLEASRSAREAEQRRERERFEAQVRSNRRLRMLAALVTVVAVVAAVIGAFALRQRSRAERQAALAAASAFRSDVDRLVSRGRNASSSDPTVDLLLAVEAHRLAPSFETMDALHWALTARPGFMGSLDTGRIGDDITVVGNGLLLVTHTVDDVQVWDVAERRRLASWPGPAGATSAFEIHSTASPDGALIAAAGPRETVIRDGRTGAVVRRFVHDAPPSAVELSPDSTRIAIGFTDGAVSLHRLGDGSLEAARPAGGAGVNHLTWLQSGDGLVVASQQGLDLWRPDEDRVEWHVDLVAAAVLGSSDGRRLVVSGERASQTDDADAEALLGHVRELKVLDASTGEEIDRLGSFGAVRFAWANERETEVVGTSVAGPISRFDLEAGIELAGPGIGSGRSEAIAALADLGLVAVAGTATVELLALDGSGPLSRVVPLPTDDAVLKDRLLTGSFDESASSLVTAVFQLKGSARRYDLRSDELIPSAVDTTFELSPIGIRRFGDLVLEATGPEYAGLIVRDDVDGPIVSDAIGVVAAYHFALSPRGDLLATAQQGGPVTVLDVATGARRYELDQITRPDFDVPTPEFTPQGRFLHVWNGASSHRFDALSGESIWTTEDWGHVFPGPDDEWVAAAEPDGTVVLRDPETLEPIGRQLVGHRGQITQFYLDPVSGRALTVADDSTARVWDTDEAKQLGRELPARSSDRGLRFFAPGAQLLANLGPAGYTIWNYDTDTWPDIACRVAGRNLTRAEWESVGPRDVQYRETCEQHPIAG
jgi:serine/threonine protein kinase/WD40 repeat protein